MRKNYLRFSFYDVAAAIGCSRQYLWHKFPHTDFTTMSLTALVEFILRARFVEMARKNKRWHKGVDISCLGGIPH